SGLDELIVTLARNLSLSFVIVTHEIHSIMATLDRAILLDKEKKGIAAIGTPQFLAYDSDSPEAARFFRREESLLAGGGKA
ncbi:MAG: polyamine ABC transporter ATP-binding protein, partial [Deltaproteobacteria bacterium]|nr:polyamine ABC transporter ATP-binding protein [Deltaproteobacteria bacterium]